MRAPAQSETNLRRKQQRIEYQLVSRNVLPTDLLLYQRTARLLINIQSSATAGEAMNFVKAATN